MVKKNEITKKKKNLGKFFLQMFGLPERLVSFLKLDFKYLKAISLFFIK